MAGFEKIGMYLIVKVLTKKYGKDFVKKLSAEALKKQYQKMLKREVPFRK